MSEDNQCVDGYVRRCIEEYLRARPETVSVEEVSSLRGCGRDEVEFIWQRRSGSIASLGGSLGSDRTRVGMVCSEDKRGELCLEVIADECRGVLGWFHADQDHLAYVSVPALELCFMSLRPVREWVLRQEQCFTMRKAMHRYPEGKPYISIGLVVSAEVLKRNLPRYVEMETLPLL